MRRGSPRRARAAAAALVGLAATVLIACASAPREVAAPAPPPTVVAGTGTFACEAPHHVCPAAFDPDLRQKACTCQGEPGRFRYHLQGR